jgi:hypothetical protein
MFRDKRIENAVRRYLAYWQNKKLPKGMRFEPWVAGNAKGYVGPVFETIRMSEIEDCDGPDYTLEKDLREILSEYLRNKDEDYCDDLLRNATDLGVTYLTKPDRCDYRTHASVQERFDISTTRLFKKAARYRKEASSRTR